MLDRKNLLQLMRFCIVGIANTAVDLGVFFVLTFGGVPYLVAQVLAYSTGVVNSFFMNRRWTFKVEGKTSWGEMSSFLLVNLSSLLLSSLLLFILYDACHVPLWLSKLAATGLCMLVNFTASRRWVFNVRKAAGDVF
ncbi:MAG: GtrA family protein [Syntrophomonadaceae bacterium]